MQKGGGGGGKEKRESWKWGGERAWDWIKQRWFFEKIKFAKL
jgi:hypothetical protein